MDIRRVAELARIDITDEEAETFGGQLEQILKHVDKLQELDVDDIDATTHAGAIFDVVREDVPHNNSLEQSVVLGNAPDNAHQQIKLPKVLDA